LRKLNDFGYDVTVPAQDRIRVAYSNAKATPIERLENFAEKLNAMVNSGVSPERVSAFVAQELNLIHAFRDGNGRTSRLLAQIFFAKMTGKTILLPRSFHREMDHSFEELVYQLKQST